MDVMTTGMTGWTIVRVQHSAGKYSSRQTPPLLPGETKQQETLLEGAERRKNNRRGSCLQHALLHWHGGRWNAHAGSQRGLVGRRYCSCASGGRQLGAITVRTSQGKKCIGSATAPSPGACLSRRLQDRVRETLSPVWDCAGRRFA